MTSLAAEQRIASISFNKLHRARLMEQFTDDTAFVGSAPALPAAVAKH
jgi:hypothetical protein